MKEKIPKKRVEASCGARKMSIRRPSTRKSPKNAIHATIPARPVVTNDVGMKPMPEEKSTFQKTVELSAASRYFSHSTPNVPGPVPNTGAVAKTFCPTASVDCQEGRTFRMFTCTA